MRAKEHLSTVYIWNATWQQGSDLRVCTTGQFYSDGDQMEHKKTVSIKFKFVKICAFTSIF